MPAKMCRAGMILIMGLEDKVIIVAYPCTIDSR